MAAESKPALAHKYKLNIDGLGDVITTEISAVNIEMKTADQKVATGDGKVYLHSYPGQPAYGDISVKVIEMLDDDAMFKWLTAVIDGPFSKQMKNGTLTQIGADNDVGDCWHFEDAWPAKWQLASSGAGTVALRIESMTLKVARIYYEPAA